MKTIVKVYDSDCPICEFFSDFDEKICKSKGFHYFLLNLSSVKTFPTIYNYLVGLVDSSGYLDVPVYLILEGSGSVVNHLKGNANMSKKQFEDLIGGFT